MLSQQTKDTLKYKYLAKLYCNYWKHKGHKTITINNHTTTIPLNTYEEAFELYVITQTEQQLIKTLLETLNPTDTFLDIGANIGVHATLAAEKLTNGHAYAIEPHPINHKTLEQNIAQNNHQKRITPLNIGLSDKNKILELTNPTTVDGSAHITQETENTLSIPAKTGDTLCNEHNITPNAIKIDVEGAEGLVINGLEQTLKNKQCHLVIIEIHHPNPNNDRPSTNDYDYSQQEIHDTLKSYGFTRTHEYDRNYETQLIYQK